MITRLSLTEGFQQVFTCNNHADIYLIFTCNIISLIADKKHRLY